MTARPQVALGKAPGRGEGRKNLQKCRKNKYGLKAHLCCRVPGNPFRVRRVACNSLLAVLQEQGCGLHCSVCMTSSHDKEGCCCTESDVNPRMCRT